MAEDKTKRGADMTIKKDFSFLKEIINDFFKQKHITSNLNKFDEHHIYGWEIWLQVELLIFLREFKEKYNIAESYREEPCLIDKRKNKSKSKCAIDFIIREKGAHSFIPLEIKQHGYAPRCIANMIRDIEKYLSIRSSELPSNRALWCLGIHKQPINQEYIDRKLIYISDDLKIVCEPIKKLNICIL